MSKADEKYPIDGMRAEYDFCRGVRGKYARRHAEGSHVVVLDPDVAACFRTSEDVNPHADRFTNACFYHGLLVDWVLSTEYTVSGIV